MRVLSRLQDFLDRTHWWNRHVVRLPAITPTSDTDALRDSRRMPVVIVLSDLLGSRHKAPNGSGVMTMSSSKTSALFPMMPRRTRDGKLHSARSRTCRGLALLRSLRATHSFWSPINGSTRVSRRSTSAVAKCVGRRRARKPKAGEHLSYINPRAQSRRSAMICTACWSDSTRQRRILPRSSESTTRKP
jgi:hypothetical protein